MLYFKRNIMYPNRRTEEYSKNIDDLFKKYELHLKSIVNSLSEGARKLASISFHDANIKTVKYVSKSIIEITIESGGYDILQKKRLDYGEYILSFSGVKKAWVPNTIIGDTWLYEEIHLSDIAVFDYQVLLDKDEIRIQAEDASVTLAKGFDELNKTK